MAEKKESDVLLDHSYDGIRELDNKLPPWWLYLFYITIIWGIGYLIYYHVLGIGDSSRAEYMKEINPDWKPAQAGSGFSIGYNSPFYGTKDVTPYHRMKRAIEKDAAARMAAASGTGETAAVSDMNFDQLIMAAMKVSSSEDLEKLRNAFPQLWTRFSQAGESPPAEAETPAEAEPVIEPLTDKASLDAGNQIFETNCVTCHGKNGEGGIGPNLTDDYYLHGKGMNSTVKVITNGVPAKGMISWRGILKEDQIHKVASFIQTLHGTNPPNAKAPQGEKIETMN